MNRYKIKTGSHLEGAKTYVKGDIVTSPHPLDTMFKEKFENLGPVAEKPQPAPQLPPPPSRPPLQPATKSKGKETQKRQEIPANKDDEWPVDKKKGE